MTAFDPSLVMEAVRMVLHDCIGFRDASRALNLPTSMVSNTVRNHIRWLQDTMFNSTSTIPDDHVAALSVHNAAPGAIYRVRDILWYYTELCGYDHLVVRSTLQEDGEDFLRVPRPKKRKVVLRRKPLHIADPYSIISNLEKRYKEQQQKIRLLERQVQTNKEAIVELRLEGEVAVEVASEENYDVGAMDGASVTTKACLELLTNHHTLEELQRYLNKFVHSSAFLAACRKQTLDVTTDDEPLFEDNWVDEDDLPF